MPRKSKPPRIRERQRNGRTHYTILHQGAEIGTSAGCREEADIALAKYIEDLRANERIGHRPTLDPDQMTVSDVLAIYAEEHAPTVVDPKRIGECIIALHPFWASIRVSSIKAEVCRRYGRERGVSPGTIRRELGCLRAALRYCEREGYLTRAPVVTLPKKPKAKDVWLTRDAASYLLRGARSLNWQSRYLQWFMIGSLYTGTRKQAMLNIEITSQVTLYHGRLDPETGILHRSGQAEEETSKRRGRAKAPRQLIGHARRKANKGERWFVQDKNGHRLTDVLKAFNRAKAAAQDLADKDGLDFDFSEITPHTLKHTAITWAIQRGAEIADVSSYFDTSIKTIEETYWHHSPHHQASAVRAMEGR